MQAKGLPSASEGSGSNGESESGSESDEGEHTIEALRETLRDLPMAKLAKLKKQGIDGVPLHRALGLPGPEHISAWLDGDFVPRAIASNTSSSRQRVAEFSTAEAATRKPEKKGKKARSAPLELSVRRQVSRFRRVVEVPNARKRDPRFDDLFGELDDGVFDKRYGFLNEEREREIADLEVALKKDQRLRSMSKDARKNKKVRALTEQEREAAKAQLIRLRQEKSNVDRKKMDREVHSEIRRTEREQVAEGKGAYFLKRRERKEVELEKRYEKLASAGKLDKYMEKRRKKNAAKERRMLPPSASDKRR